MGVHVPVHAVVAALAEKYETETAHLMTVLPSVYVMTGCDTVSFSWHRGKRRDLPLKTLRNSRKSPGMAKMEKIFMSLKM